MRAKMKKKNFNVTRQQNNVLTGKNRPYGGVLSNCLQIWLICIDQIWLIYKENEKLTIKVPRV